MTESVSKSGSPERNMIFLSHATPEDNEFARWLALQLANEGYAVWCDLTKLLGGEDFWKDIQEAIRTRSIRFLFVLSRTSNTKEGTLQELACAKAVAAALKPAVRDFIIDLKVDDLPYPEVDIEIQRLNHISFRTSWADGLANLLKKLAEDNLPKDPRFNPEAVATWWRAQPTLSAKQGLLVEPETQISNWFRIQHFPETVWCHHVTRHKPGKLDFDISKLTYPAVKPTDLSFLSFADAKQIDGELDSSIYIHSSQEIRLSDILTRYHPLGHDLVNMLRQGWEKMMEAGDFSVQRISPQPSRYYFKKGKIPDDRLFFMGLSDKRTYRDIVGFATKNGVRRYWHYAISGKPELFPFPHLVIRGHVLFSDSGGPLWEDTQKAAKARRNQCKTWWNDEWRDRMLAVTAHITGTDGMISIPMSSDRSILLSGAPETFESPVSYQSVAEMDEILDDYFEDEDDDDFEDANANEDQPVDSPA